jgi:hypothetical protein
VARALEDPFVHPPNDLPANAMQVTFNNRMLTTWDAIRSPAEVPAPSSPGDVSGEYVGDSEPELWGRYATLEAADVRQASVELLREWRALGRNERPRGFDARDLGTPKLVKMARPEARRGGNTPKLVRSNTSPSCSSSTRPSRPPPGAVELLEETSEREGISPGERI